MVLLMVFSGLLMGFDGLLIVLFVDFFVALVPLSFSPRCVFVLVIHTC